MYFKGGRPFFYLGTPFKQILQSLLVKGTHQIKRHTLNAEYANSAGIQLSGTETITADKAN